MIRSQIKHKVGPDTFDEVHYRCTNNYKCTRAFYVIIAVNGITGKEGEPTPPILQLGAIDYEQPKLHFCSQTPRFKKEKK